jgi:hypothetical protein
MLLAVPAQMGWEGKLEQVGNMQGAVSTAVFSCGRVLDVFGKDELVKWEWRWFGDDKSKKLMSADRLCGSEVWMHHMCPEVLVSKPNGRSCLTIMPGFKDEILNEILSHLDLIVNKKSEESQLYNCMNNHRLGPCKEMYLHTSLNWVPGTMNGIPLRVLWGSCHHIHHQLHS